MNQPLYSGALPGSTLKLIAIVLPLGLDTFGVAMALGLAGLPARGRLRIAMLFACFEAAMPLIGVALGAPLGHAIGSAADYLAAGLVAGLGLYMLSARGDDAEEGKRLLSMSKRGVLGAAALGMSISVDELAIGFSAGLLRLPVLPMVLAIAVQAFLLTQAGIRLGSRLAGRWREASEKLAGVALLLLGAALLTEQLTA